MDFATLKQLEQPGPVQACTRIASMDLIKQVSIFLMKEAESAFEKL